ncbi:hypothetical protein ANANG_G00001570 [Anguilla anguilla]|uniref:Phospholipase A2 n=1 Tax=Anguilla anguilla TaxID=7936 RepID=A0A9D3MVU4_ANGAN|nr:hypothetical protein ANANG_G00001570 [Anguilla anguilla]
MPTTASRIAAQALPLLSVALLRHREKRRKVPRHRETWRDAGPYWNVTVKVLRASYIPKLDVLSETDCYVSLRLPTASSRTYRTRTARKSRFPKWNETFRFRVHSHVKNILELNVCDEDLLDVDYSTVLFDLNNLYPGKRERKVFALDPKEKDELWVEFEMEESKEVPGTYITNGVLVAGPFSLLEVKVEETSKEKERQDLVLKLNGAYEQEQVIRRADPGSGPAKPVLFHISRDLETELVVHRLQEENEEPKQKTEDDLENATEDESGACTVLLRSLPADQQVIMSVPVGQDEIDLRLKATDCSDELDVRLGFDIPVEEKRFLEKRSALVSRTLQDVLHLPLAPKPDQVPVVAVVGSGGGTRAMTGLYGTLIGLQSLGLLDAVSYITGVSGSTWAMSSLYANANWSKEGLETAVSVLKKEISKSAFGILSPSQLAYYRQDLQQKAKSGQLVSFIDFLGLGIEYLIHGKKNNGTLSSQQRAVAEGQNPYPIYTAVNMKNSISGSEAVSEWCEFTPYEVGIPKYGGSVRAEDFGSEFYMGHLIKRHPEIRISYLLGLWSSVLSFNLQQVILRLMGSVPSWITGLGDEIHDTDEGLSCLPHPTLQMSRTPTHPRTAHLLHRTRRELAEMLDNLVTNRPIISHNYNFLHGFKLHWNYSENDGFLAWRDAHLDSFPNQMTPSDSKLHLVDSGFAVNSGFPPVLRPERHVDLILSFDYTWDRHQFKVLKETARYCEDYHIPFPQIDFSSLEGQPLRECYLFKDDHNPQAPIVLHFPLTNASFRQYRAPGVRRMGKTELRGGDVDVESSSSPYRTMNLTYEPEDFQRLVALAAYNVSNSQDTILQALQLALHKFSYSGFNSEAAHKPGANTQANLLSHMPHGADSGLIHSAQISI